MFLSAPARTAFLFLLASAALFAAQQQTITILSTTDLHGNIYPIDYTTDQPDERGLAKVATVVKNIRSQEPHVLLLDTGDTIEGSALAYRFATSGEDVAVKANPMMAAMNTMRFDAMVPGNHEYDFGWTPLEYARHNAHFPWLAANAYRRNSDENFFDPYVVKISGGVKVGILGLTTPIVSNWDNPERFLSRIDLRDPVAEAAVWVKKLREEEHVDVVVVAMHMGLEEDPVTGARAPGQLARENEALAIARTVPGIDVMLLGHTHREVPSLVVNGVLMTQPAPWGRSVGRVDLTLELDDTAKGESGWRIVSKTAKTIPVTGVEADSKILKEAAAAHLAAETWLNQVIADSAQEFAAGEERFHDTPLLDLVQKVQMDAGKADVSLAESVNPGARIPKGPVTVRSIFALYGVEKKVVTLEVTGKQLRDALEHSAAYFRGVVTDADPSAWVDPDIPNYNDYIADGVTYDVDVRQPLGHRIANLRYGGEELRDQQTFRLATNNYVANGAAGYTMFRDAKVVQRSGKDLRELITDWLWRTGHVPVTTDENWRLLPGPADGP